MFKTFMLLQQELHTAWDMAIGFSPLMSNGIHEMKVHHQKKVHRM
jgi:hypothetical protein